MADSTIVLITGGNTGLGYESVKALYASSKGPYTILLGSRSTQKAHNAISTLEKEVSGSSSKIVTLQVDIEDDDSIAAAFETVKSEYGRIDVLINNAGAQFDFNMPDETPASIRSCYNRTYNLNVTSTQVLTVVFEPLLLKSATPRLLFITSGLSSLTYVAANPSKMRTHSYRTSKVAMNMQMLGWCDRLRDVEPKAKVWCISPGMLATGLAGPQGADALRARGAEEPEVGGIFIKDVVEGCRDDRVGKVVNRAGVQAW